MNVIREIDKINKRDIENGIFGGIGKVWYLNNMQILINYPCRGLGTINTKTARGFILVVSHTN